MSLPRRRLPIRGSLSALALGALLFAVASCADGGLATGPEASAAASASAPSAPTLSTTSSDGLIGSLLGVNLLGSCRPLPAAHAEALIGPAGGTMQIGPHTFTVPAGALADTVRIVADLPSDSTSSVRFGPEGLTFAAGRPAQLTLSYAHCSLVSQLLPKRIAYTSDDLTQILQMLVSADQPLSARVTASIAHFSRYAVAW